MNGRNIERMSALFSRRRSFALALAAAGAIAPCGLAMGQMTGTATITTSNGAPTGAAIAQPDFSNSNLVNWEDFTDNAPGQGYPYPSGPGQVFFVPANDTINLQSVTIKGGGSAGGSLTNWTISVGTVNAAPGWGAGVTVLDSETANGTPIANDVTNGILTNYDQFTLQNQQTLTGGASGAYYFFALTTLNSSNSGGYYGLAKSAGADPNPAVSTALMDLTATSPTEEFPQSYDYTYYINGTLQTLSNNSATWANPSGGNWSSSPTDAGNWVGSAPPATSQSTATFDTDGGTITTHPTVTLVGGQTVNAVTFNNPNGYTLTGAVLNVTTSLSSLSGSNTIASLGMGTATVSASPGSTLNVTSLSHSQYSSMAFSGGGVINIGTITDPQGNIAASGGTTVNITGSIPAGAFVYDLNVATAADTINLGTGNVYDNNSIDGPGTIVIGSGSTLTTDEYNGFTFSGSLSGSGSLILGSSAGASSAGAPYTGVFLGTSPNFSGPISATYLSILQVGAGATLGNGSATNTLTLDSGELQAAGNASLPQNITIEDTQEGNGVGDGITTIDTQTNTLTLTGHISGGNGLLKVGTGTLVLGASNSYSGGTSITAGTLVVGAGGALPTNSALTIGGGSTVQLAANVTQGSQSANPPSTAPKSNITLGSLSDSGTLDIVNNHIIINYGGGSDPIATIATLINSGAYGSGTTVTWTGTGITSSAAASNPNYGIGYADAADPGNPAGLSAGQIEIMYTLLGDANLDGKVNGTDFNLMATNFNQSVTAGWDKGDFNYDGKVNGNDFVLLAANFNQFASQSAISSADEAALDAFAAANGISLENVPEPASMGLVVLAGVGALGRRGRRRKQA